MPETQETDADAVFAEAMQDGAEDKPTEQAPPEPQKIKIGEEEFTDEELATLIDKGKRASELEKGAREKFDEAAALRKQMEARESELSDMAAIWKAYSEGSPEEQRMIVKALAEAKGMTLAEAKAELTDLNADDFTESEQKIFRQLQTEKARNDRLEARLQHLEGTVKSAVVPLEEIRQYVNTEKEAKQIQADISALKEATGHDFEPERVKKWRDHGVKDVVAFVKEEVLPLAKQSMQAGAEKARKQDEAPDGTTKTLIDVNDPEKDADDVFRAYLKGEVPI